MSLSPLLLLACAGLFAGAELDERPSWRPATQDDVVPGLESALGESPALGVMVDLRGNGRLVLVRVEVDDSAGAARVAMVDGPVLGELPRTGLASAPVGSGLWSHPPGALPVREGMPADLVLFSAEHSTVEWCLPPPDQVWSLEQACSGSAVAGVDGADTVRRFELWD